MEAPNPDTRHPFNGEPHTVFLKTVITRPTIEIGDYTYYNDPEHAAAFEERNVLYHFDFVGDRLIIGRFCALASGATFIMNGANHSTVGFSTYPFAIFGGSWGAVSDLTGVIQSHRGDTRVGHDVWIGRNATILPGVTIGDGAIIGAHAVVAGDVPAYAVAVGNPARVVRYRFDHATIDRLREIAWWHWPVDRVSRNIAAIQGADLDRLAAAR